jgi:tRNA dimethylallyltransferase
MSKKILIISGPTASGKSSLALNFAEKKDIAIINADSLQIYEGLPILSSQPNHLEQKKVPHFLYSHFKAEENSSVAIWLDLVKSTVEKLWRENKLPVIVGGSGMYISKLVEGIVKIPEIDEALKIKARQLYEEIGREEFLLKLIQLGEEKEKIEKLDKHRLIRDYEVLEQTGKSIFYWQTQPNEKNFSDINFTHINLNPNREELYKNCNLRFKKMLKHGAIEEVEKILNQGISDDKQITKTLGFYEIRDFLSGRISQEEMLEIATQKTRNYAKRQLTWFRNQLPQKLVFTDLKVASNFLENEI